MTWRRRFAPILIGLVAASLVAVIWVNRGSFIPLDAGSRAPDYEAYTLTGDTVRLSELAGDVVLLNIWATWCAPCVHEMPALQRLHESLGDKGLHVVAVSVDAPLGGMGPFGQPGGDVQAFVDRFGLTFTTLHDPTGGIERRYQVQGLPTTFLIDRDGRIHSRVLGAREWDLPPLADEIRGMLED